MGARTESPGSAAGTRAAAIIEAARGGNEDRDRIGSSLARLDECERAAAIDATAERRGGLRALVDLRQHVMARRDHDPELGRVEKTLRQALGSRFAAAALVFSTIGPDTSDELLERITACESVHPIRSRADLLRRLHPTDRRCFALCHPALGDDPVVFVEVALVSGLAPSVQAILDSDAPGLDPVDADTAVFYSINNCQPGLKGIPFGAELLHRVMDHLSDTTAVTTFATLSPIPGFARWLGDVTWPRNCAVSGRSTRDTSRCAARLPVPA